VKGGKGKAHSLREITGGLRSCEGYELNLKILSFMEEAKFKERGRAGKKKRIKEVEKLSAL
jgi:N-glycosylase/DNA lyase